MESLRRNTIGIWRLLGNYSVILLLKGHTVVESVRLGEFLFEKFGFIKKNLFDKRGLLKDQIVHHGKLLQVVP